MIHQAIRRSARPYGVGLICLLLAAAAAVGAVAMRPGKEAVSAVIAQHDSWAVIRGTPDFPDEISVTVPRRTLLEGTLLCVAPSHPLPSDYPAPDTRTIRAMVGRYLPCDEQTALRKEAIYALCALQAEHPLQEGVRLTGGVVSPAQQEQRRQEAFERFRKVYPLAEALDRSRAAVPGGGESEHQTGLAVDVVLTGTLALGKSDPLDRSADGQWLHQHLWRFGFVYRNGPEGAAGVCEEIHLLYVGTVHAAAMHALQMGLEDYLALLRRERRLTLLENGRISAYLLCAPCEGDWTVKLPRDYASAQYSSDNTGWAVAAVETR